MRAPYTELSYAELSYAELDETELDERALAPRAPTARRVAPNAPHRAISLRRCALGEYPYPAVTHSNYFVLLQTIINDPAPQLPAGARSTCHPPPTHHTAAALPAAR